ncbi:MAG: BMP family ABC transporter substrate-binding protein [Desulfovibrio sp.]|nr:BMP family ABC transporter substrate-binding protein [Desulfovibrio sp.]
MRAALLCLLAIWLWPDLARGAEALKVVLILEHDGDSSFNKLLIAGLERAKREPDVEGRVIVAGKDPVDAFRRAAGEADLVIVATDAMHEILRDNAGAFRSVKFGAIDAGIRARNIMSVTFADEQAAYLAGAIAAMSSDGPLAWLSGADVPSLRSLYNGFVEGAKLADPDRVVVQAVSGSFTDGMLAADKARALASRHPGVAVLASGLGNAAAEKELGRTPVIALDAADDSPRVFGSIVKALDRAVYEIVSSAASGRFAAKEIRTYDLANGGVDFILSKASAKKYPDAARRLAELKGEFAKGSIPLRSARQRTLCDCLD